MFVVNVMPNNSNANISLAYKTEEKAREAYNTLFNACKKQVKCVADDGEPKILARVSDDFGSDIMIDNNSVSHVVFIDVAKSQWREWEMSMAVEKVRATLGKRSPLLAT